MNTMETAKVAGYVNPNYNNSLSKRIEQDEAELATMINGEEVDENSPAPTKKNAAAEIETSKEVEEKLSKEEETYKKRYGDLRVHMNNLTQQLKDTEVKIQEATATGKITSPKSPEEVEAWMRKYPDVAAVVEAIADKKATERFKYADERLSRIDQMNAEAERTQYEAEIRAVHDDFDDLRESDVFHTWASEQPKWVQDALYENSEDPKSVIKVVTLYKYENGLDVKGRKSADKNAASAVVTKRTRPSLDSDYSEGSFKESDINKMSMNEYEKKQDLIMDAIRKGKFIYDVSGGAR